MSNKTLEGMARVGWASGNPMLQRHLECFPKEEAIEIDKMRHALFWLADRIEENGELTADCKRAAVSAYLSTGQNGRGMVEPVRLMKAIAAFVRAAAEKS